MELECEAEIHDLARKVRDALEQGEDPRRVGDAKAFGRAAAAETSIDDTDLVWPMMKWEEQKRRLATLRKSERFKLAAFWRVLRDEVERAQPLQGIELRRDEPGRDGELQDRVHVWWRAVLKIPDVPVILLDAALDTTIACQFFPRLKDETIAAERRAEVVQVIDTPCSRNRLLGFEGADAEEQARAANRLEDVRHLAEVEAKRGRTLLVTYKAAEARLGAIPGVDITHFGALRGSTATRTMTRSSSLGGSSRHWSRSRTMPARCSATMPSPWC
jgi:hypothetical protein